MADLRSELLEIRRALKAAHGETLEKLLRRRMEIQLKHPELDPMIETWLPIVDKHRALFKGRILDAGCFTGYLYHYLGKPEGYVGIDTCDEMIKVAREFSPAEFRVQNLLDVKDRFDVVWCSQLAFPKLKMTADFAFERLKAICDTLIFVVAREHAKDFTKPSERMGRMLVSIKGRD